MCFSKSQRSKLKKRGAMRCMDCVDAGRQCAPAKTPPAALHPDETARSTRVDGDSDVGSTSTDATDAASSVLTTAKPSKPQAKPQATSIATGATTASSDGQAAAQKAAAQKAAAEKAAAQKAAAQKAAAQKAAAQKAAAQKAAAQKAAVEASTPSDERSESSESSKMLSKCARRMKEALGSEGKGKAERLLGKYKDRPAALAALVERRYGWDGDGAERGKRWQAFQTFVRARFASKEKRAEILRAADWRSVEAWLKRSKESSKETQKKKKTKKRKLQCEDEEEEDDDGKQQAQQHQESSKRRSTTTCDKCDGKHRTEACPHYVKPRDKHPDARRGRGGLSELGGGNKFVRLSGARVKSMPGDGSCLYHSLRHGLGGAKAGISSTKALRQQLANWVKQNANEKIAGTAVKDWVRWDASMSVDRYASNMRGAAWGGGIELAACSQLFDVRVCVWERSSGGFKLISSFASRRPSRVINVLYCGGIHYDYIDVYGPIQETAQKKSSASSARFGKKKKQTTTSTTTPSSGRFVSRSKLRGKVGRRRF